MISKIFPMFCSRNKKPQQELPPELKAMKKLFRGGTIAEFEKEISLLPMVEYCTPMQVREICREEINERLKTPTKQQ